MGGRVSGCVSIELQSLFSDVLANRFYGCRPVGAGACMAREATASPLTSSGKSKGEVEGQ